MQNFLQKSDDTFANRIWFVGLQGSFARGKTTLGAYPGIASGFTPKGY